MDDASEIEEEGSGESGEGRAGYVSLVCWKPTPRKSGSCSAAESVVKLLRCAPSASHGRDRLAALTLPPERSEPVRRTVSPAAESGFGRTVSLI
jgi:hypothetical protein